MDFKLFKWWINRTFLEKILLIAFLAAIFVIAAYILLSKHNSANKNNHPKFQNYCITPECIQTASTILEGMDESVNPCDNFYQFACGKFLREQFIPDGQVHIGRFSALTTNVANRLNYVIAANITADDITSFKLVKNFYKSCMDEKAIEAEGIKPLKDIINEMGGWPVVLGKEWKNQSWVELTGKFLKFGYPPDVFIGLGLGLALTNSTNLKIFLYPPSTGLLDSNITNKFNSSDVMKYYNHSVNVAVKFGANRTVAVKELREMVEFDMNLTQILEDVLNKSSSISHEELLKMKPRPLKNITASYPSIKWIDYINNYLYPYATVDMNESVYLILPTYFSDLEKLLNRTSNRVLANYAIWQLISLSAPYVSKDIQMEEEGKPTGRWKMCLSEVSVDLMVATSALYVRNHVDKTLKKTATEMVTYVQEEFRRILSKVNWMNDITRKNALAKADAMIYHIAYPNELLINNKLEKYYQNLKIDSAGFLRNKLNIANFLRDETIRQFKHPLQHNVWSEHAISFIVNAFSNPTENSVDIPAAIMQGSFFNPHRPQYMNYGAIGFVIGHEITHGFDNVGRQFDKEGNLRDWWDAKSEANFKKKAQCIIDQYSNYTVEELGLKLNGTQTQGENIADIGAAKIVYNAYKQYVKHHGEELRLPGLDYTNEQMVWISMASNWCEKIKHSFQKSLIKYDVHSPGVYRVIGSVSNSYEFAESFNCPVGSKMNPKTKCTVW